MYLLGWHWFIKPCWFQVYDSTKRHPHTALCAHCPKQSLFPPLLIAPLPTSNPYPLFLWLSPHCCLYIRIWVFFLIPSPFILHPNPTPFDSCQSIPCNPTSVSILFVSFFFIIVVHEIPHLSEIMCYLSFSDWLVSLGIIIFRPIHAVTKVTIFLIRKNICTSLVIAVLFTIAKIWKQPKCLSVDE